MQVSNHLRRRALVSPVALVTYGLIWAALSALGVWVNVELGAEGNAPVPIGLIVPALGGLGLVGVIIGRGSARPPGGPLRPAPPPPRAITRAAVTAITSHPAQPSDQAFTPPNVLAHTPEVTP